MSDENRYFKSNVRKSVHHDDEDTFVEEEAWDYAEEAWGRTRPEVTDRVWVNEEGMRRWNVARKEIPDWWYGEAAVRWVAPRLPADMDMMTMGAHFPPEFEREGQRAWIMGFRGFYVDPETQHRHCDLILAMDGPMTQLRDLPSPSPRFVERHYVITPTNVLLDRREDD